MSKVFDLCQSIRLQKESIDKKRIDIEASYVALDQCITILKMNELHELIEARYVIEKTMKKLKKEGKKWHRMT